MRDYIFLLLAIIFCGLCPFNTQAQEAPQRPLPAHVQERLDFALMEAASGGYVSAADSLLKMGADVNATDFYGTTVLMFAVKGENHFMVDFLLQQDADVDNADRYGINALMYALYLDDLSIARTLVGVVDDLNHQDRQGNTALMLVAQNGNLALAQAMEERGADVNLQNRKGVNALMFAAAFGNFFLADYLLFSGADLQHQATDGSTALHLAAWYGHTEIHGLLLDEGAEINVKDNQGNTPLHYAVLAGDIVSVWYLIESGADPAAMNNNELTPLTMAVGVEDEHIVEMLISYNYTEPIASRKKNTAFARAYFGNDSFIPMLREFSDLKPRGLYFSKFSTGAGMEFNGADLMYRAGISFFEARYNILLSIDFAKRFQRQKVLVLHNDELLYQFLEDRTIWSMGLQQRLTVLRSLTRSAGLQLGGKLIYTTANYSGSGIQPPSGIMAAPALDLFYKTGRFRFEAGYYFLRTGQTDIPAHRYHLKVMYNFPLYKSSRMRLYPVI